MGHALNEIHRVLKPDGIVVDIRPNYPAHKGNRRRAQRQVVCIEGEREIPVGVMRRELSKFRYTDRLVEKALRRGGFTLVTRETFYFRHHFRSFVAFNRFKAEQWSVFKQSLADRRRLEKVIRTYPDAHIRADDPVQLNVMRKT